MKKAKKILLTAGAYLLTAALAIGGTVAYLQSEDSDVNVMTLGNVKIEQIEQERIDASKLPTAEDNLREFKQNKPLFPAVFEGSSIDWDTESVSNQAWKIVDRNNKNVIDKFVTVKNTGKSDAFVRTLVAYEGNAEYGPNGAYIHVVSNGTNVNPAIPNNFIGYIEVDGVDYTVYEYIYPEALKAGETSIPSLKQVYMNKAADNDVVEKYGEAYDILVISQAVQAAGFDSAATALDTAFGKTADNAAKWFGGLFKNPLALVTVLDENDTITNAEGVTVFGKNRTIDTTNSKMGFDLGELELDTAYQFQPHMSAEDGAKSDYADWHADFVVTVDKDIPAYGIGLAGYYDAWCSLNDDKWVMLASDAPIAAGTEIRLIEAMGGGGITVAYSELCNYGNDGIGFLCGAVDLSGKYIEDFNHTVEQIPAGTTITVELRLYEATGGSSTTETGNYITTGVYSYTFK